MNTRVRLPANMHPLADGQAVVEQSGSTVGEVLRGLVERYPELEPRLFSPAGELQSFVNVFIHNQSIRELQDLETPVDSEGELLVLAALAGG